MASCQRNRGTSLDFCETRRQQGCPTSRGARLSDEQTRNPGATAEWTRILRDVTQKGGKVNQPKNFGHIFSFFFFISYTFFFFSIIHEFQFSTLARDTIFENRSKYGKVVVQGKCN